MQTNRHLFYSYSPHDSLQSQCQLGKAQEQSKMLIGLMIVLFFYFISLHFRTRNIEIISQSQVKDMVDYLPVFFSVHMLKEGSRGVGGMSKNDSKNDTLET